MSYIDATQEIRERLKGMGLINDPKKALYNKAYNKTTFSVNDIVANTTSLESTNAKNTPGE